MRLRSLVSLFWSFAKVGALPFGGGYAMLPLLQREIVERRGWATEEELTDYYAISQCTPGPIALNTATFVGQKQGGLAGGVAATLGLIFPSLVIILLIAALLRNFSDLPLVKNAFAGIRVVVCVLLVNSVVRLAKKTVIDLPALLIFLAVFALAVFTGISPALLILAAALAGLLIRRPGAKR
jgi:chromate transporter